MRRVLVDFVAGCGNSKAAIIRAGDDAAAAIIHHPALAIARKDPLVKFLPPPSPGTPITGYEDLSVGQSFALGSVEIDRDDIFEFARIYDPQPFHLDEDAAEKS